MRKIICIGLAAAALVFGAHAQGSLSLGVGYANDNYVSKTIGGLETSSSVDSVCVDLQAFFGRDVGFYAALAGGLPVARTTKTGSFSTVSDMDSYSTRVHLNGVAGAGFSLSSGPLGIVLGGGFGYSHTKFVTTGSFVSTTAVSSTGGLGFGLSLAYRLKTDLALQASLHGLYGLFTFEDSQKDSFVSGLTLTPALGLRYRLR